MNEGEGVIRFRCPACDEKLEVSAETAGQRLLCPTCQRDIQVPTPVAPEESTAVEIPERMSDAIHRTAVAGSLKKGRSGIGAFLVILLMVFAVSGAAAYWYWTGTPQYSFSQVKVAIEEHDLPKFEEYVDLDTVVRSFVDDMLAMATDEMQKQQMDAAERTGADFAMVMIQMMKPRLIDEVNTQIRRMVEQGEIEKSTDATVTNAPAAEEGKEPHVPLDQMSDNLGTTKEAYGGIKYVKREGRIAIIGVSFKEEEETVLDLKFRKVGRQWQMIQLSNARAILEKTKAQTQRTQTQPVSAPDAREER